MLLSSIDITANHQYNYPTISCQVEQCQDRRRINKPHKYILSVLQSITLLIPMQQGKTRSHGKGAREKGAKAKE